MFIQKDLSKNVHNTLIHNPKLETIQLSIIRRVTLNKGGFLLWGGRKFSLSFSVILTDLIIKSTTREIKSRKTKFNFTCTHGNPTYMRDSETGKMRCMWHSELRMRPGGFRGRKVIPRMIRRADFSN